MTHDLEYCEYKYGRKHDSRCDHKLIDGVNWTSYRNYQWADLNPKTYRQKYIIGN